MYDNTGYYGLYRVIENCIGLYGIVYHYIEQYRIVTGFVGLCRSIV